MKYVLYDINRDSYLSYANLWGDLSRAKLFDEKEKEIFESSTIMEGILGFIELEVAQDWELVLD